MSYSLGIAKVATVDKQLQERDEFLAEIRDRLIQAQRTMKQYQDKARREVGF
jgi:flagellin-like hook-associated protein FlgL